MSREQDKCVVGTILCRGNEITIPWERDLCRGNEITMLWEQDKIFFSDVPYVLPYFVD